MTAIDPAAVKAGDTVALTRKMSSAVGPVTRIDRSDSKGVGFHIDGYPYPLWVGNRHDSWTLTAHQPGAEIEWKPGTSGTATVDGFPRVRVMRVIDTNGRAVWVSSVLEGELLHYDEDVTDFVPDEPGALPTRQQVLDAVSSSWHNPSGYYGTTDAIMALLRGESR